MKTLNEIITRVQADLRKKEIARIANWEDFSQMNLRRYCEVLGTFAVQAVAACGKNVVEIGTDYGLGAYAMGWALRGLPNIKVLTFDNRLESTMLALKRGADLEMPNIKYIHGTSATLHKEGDRFSLVYIDGDHSLDGCLADLRNVSPLVDTHGLILCHDYSWLEVDPRGNGVRQAIGLFLEERQEWAGMFLNGFAILGRKLK